MDTPLLREKIAQAKQALQELDVDLWLLAGRETGEMPDPSFPLVVGTSVTWTAFFLIGRNGENVAIVGTGDVENVKATGAWDEVTGTVWVANEDGDSLTVLDAATGEVVSTITGIESPHNLQASPEGDSVWAVSGHDKGTDGPSDGKPGNGVVGRAPRLGAPDVQIRPLQSGGLCRIGRQASAVGAHRQLRRRVRAGPDREIALRVEDRIRGDTAAARRCRP